jgi:hypothetical protein
LVADARIALVEEVEENDRSRRLIVGTGVGSAQIGCRWQDITAAVSVVVVPFNVELAPSTPIVAVGAATSLTAEVTREGGADVPLLNPLRVEWSATPTGRVQLVAGSTPGTATITGLTPGTATVTATVRGFTDFGVLGSQSVVVTVLPPP